MSPDVVNRFWTKVDKSGACWVWMAGRSAEGYGHFHHQRRTLMAHRVAYELSVGPIPEGLHIDHLCRNTSCVRPNHLEPVTPQVNTLRGIGLTALNARKTHCPQGHEYTAANTMPTPSGGRTCRHCGRVRFKEWATKNRPPRGRPTKTHCPQHHPYDNANTYVTPDGKRACRTCRTARSAEHKRRKRDAA